MKKQPDRVDAHFSPITWNVSTRKSTRNVCNMKYTAIVKIESLKDELNDIMTINRVENNHYFLEKMVIMVMVIDPQKYFMVGYGYG